MAGIEYPVNIDLDAALIALQNKQRKESPWDDAALHVSDLALCKRQVWARRNQLTETFIDLDNYIQMQLGLKYEEIVCAALDAADVKYEYQVPVKDPIFGHKLIGTADFVFEDAVLDTKTTTFWSGYVGKGDARKKQVKIPEEPKYGYRVQAAAYAIALGKPRYGLQVVCRASGRRVTFWYETSGMASVIGKAVVDMESTTTSDPEPVDAKPPWYTEDADGKSWQCGYCPHAACELNTNAALQVL
jgi:hypothetical protein